PALRIVAQNDALMVLDEALTEEEYAIAVRKDNPELLAAINAALADLEATGKKAELLEKYGLNVAEDAE
ncbi:MAG: transporter substrate-binding domain-containing protein, partial [Oscillospiraceae bacterium]|nr:transporter substrate-binding domain-containing protein [Oscillospiraceae bacterium]